MICGMDKFLLTERNEQQINEKDLILTCMSHTAYLEA